MLGRIVILGVVASALGCSAGTSPSLRAIGLFYSFERPFPAEPLLAMESELAHILAPAGIVVEWRSLSGQVRPAQLRDDFPQILVFRFRGACAPEGISGGERTGATLAAAQMTDLHVLPFADVDCDGLRRTMNRGDVTCDLDFSVVIGRAMARVVAHELFHMLIGSTSHALTGVARAAYSRDDLTAEELLFTASDIACLRRWAQRRLR